MNKRVHYCDHCGVGQSSSYVTCPDCQHPTGSDPTPDTIYEKLCDGIDRRFSIHVLSEREDFAWTVEWDDEKGAFRSAVTQWFDKREDGYGDVVTEEGLGITRADAAERAMDAFLVSLYAFNHARELIAHA